MDREAIEKELEWFPRKWAIAFAARCAAQCLPALLEKQRPGDSYFAYWAEQKLDQHLFAVLRANSMAYAFNALSYHDNATVAAFANAFFDTDSFTYTYDATSATFATDVYVTSAISTTAAISAVYAFAASTSANHAVAY
ncbi:MAG: hypothetical protein D3910_17390, partial [Candidatus Electrothrix sp. ATG2]|nr:hypothetical protein [Candidatus Electrothrix sp. ATG2]